MGRGPEESHPGAIVSERKGASVTELMASTEAASDDPSIGPATIYRRPNGAASTSRGEPSAGTGPPADSSARTPSTALVPRSNGSGLPAMPAPLTPRHLDGLGADDRARTLLEAYLRTRSNPRTRTAYRLDVEHWLAFCATCRLDPLIDPRGVHVEAWIAAQRDSVPPPAASTSVRRLAAVSSWYRWLVRDDFAVRNPVEGVPRPRVARDESATVGLSREQAAALLDAADTDADPRANHARNRAAVTLLLDNALRCGELIDLDLADLGSARGHRTLRVRGKGGTLHIVPLAPATIDALQTWLDVRGGDPGPLFTSTRGNRLTHSAVFRLVRRLAELAHRARPDLGMAEVAQRLSPHGLRHTAITAVLDAGVSLRDAQDFARHADPRTTRIYDRNRGALDRNPTYVLSTYLAAARVSSPGSGPVR